MNPCLYIESELAELIVFLELRNIRVVLLENAPLPELQKKINNV
jgi:hypothetical protein